MGHPAINSNRILGPLQFMMNKNSIFIIGSGFHQTLFMTTANEITISGRVKHSADFIGCIYSPNPTATDSALVLSYGSVGIIFSNSTSMVLKTSVIFMDICSHAKNLHLQEIHGRSTSSSSLYVIVDYVCCEPDACPGRCWHLIRSLQSVRGHLEQFRASIWRDFSIRLCSCPPLTGLAIPPMATQGESILR